MSGKTVCLMFFFFAFFDLGDVVGFRVQHKMTEFMGGAENASFNRNPLPYVHHHSRTTVLFPHRQAEKTIGGHGDRENLDARLFEQATNVMDRLGGFQAQFFTAKSGRLYQEVRGALCPDTLEAERHLFVHAFFKEVEIIKPSGHFSQDILAILHPLCRSEPDGVQFTNRLEKHLNFHIQSPCYCLHGPHPRLTLCEFQAFYSRQGETGNICQGPLAQAFCSSQPPHVLG